MKQGDRICGGSAPFHQRGPWATRTALYHLLVVCISRRDGVSCQRLHAPTPQFHWRWAQDWGWKRFPLATGVETATHFPTHVDVKGEEYGVLERTLPQMCVQHTSSLRAVGTPQPSFVAGWCHFWFVDWKCTAMKGHIRLHQSWTHQSSWWMQWTHCHDLYWREDNVKGKIPLEKVMLDSILREVILANTPTGVHPRPLSSFFLFGIYLNWFLILLFMIYL